MRSLVASPHRSQDHLCPPKSLENFYFLQFQNNLGHASDASSDNILRIPQPQDRPQAQRPQDSPSFQRSQDNPRSPPAKTDTPLLPTTFETPPLPAATPETIHSNSITVKNSVIRLVLLNNFDKKNINIAQPPHILLNR